MEDIAQVFLKRPGVILLVVLGFVGPTLGFSHFFPLFQTPVYEASAKLAVGVGQNPGVNQDTNVARGWRAYEEELEELTASVVEAIDSRPVAEEAIQRLGLRMEPGELLENLTVDQEGSTILIQLSYKDTDPERAQLIANTVAEVASEQISQETPYDFVLRIHVWEDAFVPSTPANPDPVRSAMKALILGLAAGIGLALMMEQRAT